MADFPFGEALTVIYSPNASNQERHEAIEALEGAIARLTGDEVVTIGLQMAQSSESGAEVCAYGASMVARALREGRANPASVPYAEIAAYLASDGASLHRLVTNSLSDVLVEVATLLWPDQWPDLLDVICPPNLSTHSAFQRTLLGLLLVCDDPPLDRLTRDRISTLKRALKTAAPMIAERLATTLFDQYSRGERDAPAADMGVCLECLDVLVRSMAERDVWAWSIDAVCATLMTFKPSAHKAVITAAAILSRIKVETADDAPRALAFVNQLLTQALDAINGEEWDAVQAVLDVSVQLASTLTPDSPLELCQSLAAFAQQVLGVPSVAFASSACEVLLAVAQRGFDFIDVREVLMRLRGLAPKHRSHPGRLDGNPSAEFSRLQFPTAEAFDIAFAEMRTRIGDLLKRVAEALPSLATEFTLHLVTNHLPSPTPDDPRTPCGHVTQLSFTFTEWETTCFVIEQLQGALLRTTEFVAETLSELMSPKAIPDDAVLLPIFINILVALCRYPLVDWPTVLDVLFTCMTMNVTRQAIESGRPNIGDDLDLASARKRAHTALISLCTTYPHQLFDHRELIWASAQRLLVRPEDLALGEAGFLYEAVAALSNGMTADDQAEFLSRIVAPIRSRIVEQCEATTAESLAEMLSSNDRRAVQQRHTFLNELIVLVSVLRRCDASPYMEGLAKEMLPAFGNLLLQMQRVGELLSPELQRAIFGMDDAAIRQAQGGGNRQSNAVVGRRKSSEEKLHGYFNKLRQTLHQALGSIAKFQNPSEFADGWAQLLEGAASMDIESMRSLCEHCLFIVGVDFPAIVLNLFPAVSRFLLVQAEQCKGSVGSTATAGEVAASKWLHHYCKDVISFVQRVVIGPKLHVQEPAAAVVLVELLHALYVTAFDTRGTLGLIQPLLLEQARENNGKDWAVRFYAMMCAELVTNANFNEFDTRSVLFSLADLYKKEFPLFAEALTVAGCAQEDVEKLNFALTMIPRIEGQRKKFGEVLTQILTRDNAVCPFQNWQI